MKTIPIKQAEGFAIANNLNQVIIFGHDGERTHVVTWGNTVEHSAQAAAGANHIKKLWKWPDDTIVESAKVQALLDRIAELEAKLSPPQKCYVHVIEGTEYERGWGQRPDGYVALASRKAAEDWILDYNIRNNNLPSAPDEYTTYKYIGIKECSQAFFSLLEKKHSHHFTRTSEMLE